MVNKKSKPRKVAPRKQPRTKIVLGMGEKMEESTPPLQSEVPITKPDPPTETPTSETLMPTPGRQCFKCQRWGHISTTCNFPDRCVKCGLGHKSSDCPKTKEEDPCCANCQSKHTASYRGCPAAPKIRRRRRQRHRRPHSINGLPTCPWGTLNSIMSKLLRKEGFFNPEQWSVISGLIDDTTKEGIEKVAPPTSPKLVPRPVQLAEIETHSLKTPTNQRSDPEPSSPSPPAKISETTEEAPKSLSLDDLNNDDHYFVTIVCSEGRWFEKQPLNVQLKFIEDGKKDSRNYPYTRW